MLFVSFFNGQETADRIQIAIATDRFFRGDQCIDIQKPKIAIGEARGDALFPNRFKISDTSNFAEAVQFAQIRLQIQIFQISETASCFFHWQFIGGQSMNRM
ncbi:MAG TPA: hypothetical protein VIV82_05070 [Verrucomicrobiae bacterium]